MSKTNTEGREIDYRLTRSATQIDPELKEQVDSAFKRSTKISRSPIKLKLSVFSFDLENKKESKINKNTGINPKILNLNKNKLTIDIREPETANNKNIENTSDESKSPTKYYSPFPLDITLNEQENTLNRTINNTLKTEISLIDIEGINEQPKLIGNNNGNNNLSLEIDNLLNETMAENPQPLRLTLKHVASLVPEFDGKNISVNEYIGQLKHAKSIITATDEPNLIPILKIKLKGEVYKALLNTRITTINDFIKAIRKLYPSTENIHSLYGKLTEIIQRPDETVLSYANRLQELVLQIKELKKSETGITDRTLEAFDTNIQNDALKSFKSGLKQEIRLELKEQNHLDSAIQESITIETNLKRHESLRNSPINTIWGKEPANTEISKIHVCQICQDIDHEALFCDRAACVYCKSKDHLSYNCRAVTNKIELICKFCNAKGHSIDGCRLNKLKGNHCQYCQVMGHVVTQCPFIIEYEVCWRCKGSGHDPNTCTNLKNQPELCENCKSTEHATKDCPTVVCQRCNKVGHTIKNCPILNNFSKFFLCSICKEQGHESNDCEEAKILVTQSRLEKKEDTTICQFCSKIGHSAKTCRELRYMQPTSSNDNSYTNNRNFSRYNREPGNTNNYSYKGKNSGNLNRRYCDYCKGQNHTIDECRKLENLKIQVSQQGNCSYCKEAGHEIESCKQLVELEKKAKQFCNFCKNTNHTTEQCYARKNLLQRKQGNE